ncbi:MAG: glutamyl-tRNA reductase [Phycisphaerae bacterium]|nr:MAG: glutamyl-tRNA reductase [Phycisphaerae bacterium]
MDGIFCIAASGSALAIPTPVDLNLMEHVALNTCERNELYAIVPGKNFAALSRETNAQILEGRSAVNHLLRVAAGLESRIVGEPHVLGQVRKAFAHAESQQTSGTKLAALFRAALRTGRRVRAETSLNSGNESVVTLAARRLLGATAHSEDRCYGIVGTGAVARDVAHELANSGVNRILAFSRSYERIREIDWKGSVALPLDELQSVVAQLDGLIACSKVEHPIVEAGHFVRCADGFPVIDLGSPANVGDLSGAASRVSLTRLADLKRTAPTHQLRAANRIVNEELARLEEWFQHRKIARSIERMVREANLPPQRSTPTLHAKIMRAKAQVAA